MPKNLQINKESINNVCPLGKGLGEMCPSPLWSCWSCSETWQLLSQLLVRILFDLLVCVFTLHLIIQGKICSAAHNVANCCFLCQWQVLNFVSTAKLTSGTSMCLCVCKVAMTGVFLDCIRAVPRISDATPMRITKSVFSDELSASLWISATKYQINIFYNAKKKTTTKNWKKDGLMNIRCNYFLTQKWKWHPRSTSVISNPSVVYLRKKTCSNTNTACFNQRYKPNNYKTMFLLRPQNEPFYACAARMRAQKQNCVCVCVCWSHLNIDNRDGGLGFVEVPSHPVHSLGDKVQHQIQINLIFLKREEKKINFSYKKIPLFPCFWKDKNKMGSATVI